MKKNCIQPSLGDLVIFNPIIGRFDETKDGDSRAEAIGQIMTISEIRPTLANPSKYKNITNYKGIVFVLSSRSMYMRYLALEDEIELVSIR